MPRMRQDSEGTDTSSDGRYIVAECACWLKQVPSMARTAIGNSGWAFLAANWTNARRSVHSIRCGSVLAADDGKWTVRASNRQH